MSQGLNKRQDEVGGVRDHIDEALGVLLCAEICDTTDSFNDYLDQAEKHLRAALAALTVLQIEARRG